MDYIKIRFGRSHDRLGHEMERSLEGLFRSMNPMFALSEHHWKPQMDIYETAEEFIVLAELAGVDEENLDIEVSNKAIKIAGRRPIMVHLPENNYHLAEIRYGEFERTLYLPALIDPEVVSAACNRGMLKIRLAKHRPEAARRIPIEGR
jgi:HSP20 family protein